MRSRDRVVRSRGNCVDCGISSIPCERIQLLSPLPLMLQSGSWASASVDYTRGVEHSNYNSYQH